jgi:hypothetical protein
MFTQHPNNGSDVHWIAEGAASGGGSRRFAGRSEPTYSHRAVGRADTAIGWAMCVGGRADPQRASTSSEVGFRESPRPDGREEGK